MRTVIDERFVLVVTGVDATADEVIAELNRRGVPVARFDLADFPGQVEFSAELGDGGLSGVLDTPSRTVDLHRVRSVYYRRPGRPEWPDLPLDEARFAAEDARMGFGGILQSLGSCRYVNHPRRTAAAEWKPAQLMAAAQLGFQVPATLITNQAGQARDFARRRGRIVYKPLTFYAQQDNAIWVGEVDPTELDESLVGTAHMFQVAIEKQADVRVTVVGDKVFPVRIESPLLDWRERYDLIERYTVIEPSNGMVARLRSYLKHWGLWYGCFDFSIDTRGEWWFLECNPAGEWGWIAAETGLPIARAFADVLEAG